MIHWNCRLYSSPISNVSDTMNISNLTLLDTPAIFSIQTTTSTQYSNTTTTIIEQRAYIEELCGNCANAIYSAPNNLGLPDFYRSIINSYFPSILQNFVTAFSEYSEGLAYFIEIPSLKRVLCMFTDGNIRAQISVYTIDGSTITRTFGPSINGIYYALRYTSSNLQQCIIDVPCLVNYNSNIDLREYTNWAFARIRFESSNPSRGLKYYQPANSTITAFLNALFETGKEQPDTEPLPPENPYEPGGPSGEGGGGGSFDDDSDIIGIPDLPTLSAANTGFTRIYNPTLSQVQDLARYLWTDETVIQTIWNHIKQFFENPMEAIIGFNLVPVPVPDGGTKNFALMYIDTGVQMTVAANQFVDVDCGTLEIKKYFGSALDYAPYTKISCYLPYIGVVTLNTDEVMGRTLQVVYRVDICSGSCVAYITVDGNAIYQYSGHCAINIPMSAADFSSYVNAAISVGKLAGTLALGASGIAGAAAVSEVTQTTGETTSRIVNTERNAATGRQITTGTQTVTKGPQEITTTKASYSGIPPANITNTAGEVISSKPHVEHSGSFSGNSGYLGVRRPFVIIQRPNMCMPENYQTLNGFPSMITMKLSECTGFTRIQQVQLTNMGQATNPEQAEIQQLLKMGVIF